MLLVSKLIPLKPTGRLDDPVQEAFPAADAGIACELAGWTWARWRSKVWVAYPAIARL
jgi:hypothetical protein